MGSNGITVMGQMGINLQLVDVIYPFIKGSEGPELASSLIMHTTKAAHTRLLEEVCV